MHITKEKLNQLLSLQHHLNDRINPNWVASSLPFCRAIMHEAIEAQDHIGWAWWRKQSPDIPQAKLEAVDILHFMLSRMIVAAYEGYKKESQDPIPHNTPAGALWADVWDKANEVMVKGFTSDEMIFFFLGEPHSLATKDALELLDIIAGAAAFDKVFLAAYAQLIERLGMNWDEVIRLYISKNVLNTFRQKHGYKQGTYIKTWNGDEDNMVLDRLYSSHVNTEGIVDIHGLDRALEAEYSKVLTGA